MKYASQPGLVQSISGGLTISDMASGGGVMAGRRDGERPGSGAVAGDGSSLESRCQFRGPNCAVGTYSVQAMFNWLDGGDYTCREWE